MSAVAARVFGLIRGMTSGMGICVVIGWAAWLVILICEAGQRKFTFRHESATIKL